MAKFIAKTQSVDNSNLKELDDFVPANGTSNITWTIGPNTYEISSVYKNEKLTVKWSDNGLKYTLKAEVSTKQLKTVFKGDSWEQKFFKGGDTIKGSTASDMLFGFKGGDNISGKAGDDTINGGAGKDFLDGGTGVNSLTGGGGKDMFAFSAALVGGNYAQIEDFKHGVDQIQLDKGAFAGIGAKGTLKAGKFFLASEYDGKAKSVIYDDTNGNLHYSKDGGDLANAQIFGRIGNGAELDNKDFLIA